MRVVDTGFKRSYTEVAKRNSSHRVHGDQYLASCWNAVPLEADLDDLLVMGDLRDPETLQPQMYRPLKSHGTNCVPADPPTRMIY